MPPTPLVEDARSFAPRVLTDEALLYRVLLGERIVVPLALGTMMVASGAELRAVLWTSALVAWGLVTGRLMWNRLALLKRYPALLAAELAMTAAVFLGIGHWRGDFQYALAEATVFAAAFVGLTAALIAAGAASAVIVVALGALELPDGRGPLIAGSVQYWLGPVSLLFAAAFLVSYVRTLLDRLRTASATYDAQAIELAEAEAEATVAEAQAEVVYELLHRRLQQLLPMFRLQLNVAAADESLDPSLAGRLRSTAEAADETDVALGAIADEYAPPDVRAGPAIGVADPAGPAIGVADPGQLAREVAGERWHLYRAIVWARLLFALSLGLMIPEQAEFERFGVVLGLWLALCIWVVATTAFAEPLYDVVRKRPGWLLVEQMVGVALLVLGTNEGGNIFWTQTATAAVLAAAVSGWRLAAAFGLVALAASITSTVVAAVAAWQAVPGPAGLVLTTAGYFGVVAPAIYLSLVFGRLERAALAFAGQVRSIQNARVRAASAEVASAVSPRVNTLFEEKLPLLRQQLADVERDAAASGAAPDLRQAWLVLDEINRRLRRLRDVSRLGNPPARAATVAEIVDSACREQAPRPGPQRIVPREAGSVVLAAARATALGSFVAEALANAWKHGRPPVRVEVSLVASALRVDVHDYGGGFDTAQPEAGLGLASMRRNAALLGGTLAVASTQDGTGVTLTVPLEGAPR